MNGPYVVSILVKNKSVPFFRKRQSGISGFLPISSRYFVTSAAFRSASRRSEWALMKHSTCFTTSVLKHRKHYKLLFLRCVCPRIGRLNRPCALSLCNLSLRQGRDWYYIPVKDIVKRKAEFCISWKSDWLMEGISAMDSITCHALMRYSFCAYQKCEISDIPAFCRCHC